MRGGGIRAPIEVRDAILAHARRERPNECCGFLVGHAAEISHAVPTQNVAASPVRYRVDDAAHLRLRRALRGWLPPAEIVGVYHSHPAGPPAASATDIAEAMYPEWVYLIAGLTGAREEIRAFRMTDGRAQPVPIRWERGRGGAIRRALRS